MNHNIESADMRFAFCAAFLHYVFFVPGLGESFNFAHKSISSKSSSEI